MILVDTSVWIDFFRLSPGSGGAELRRLIRAQAPLALAGIIAQEILQGLASDKETIAALLAHWPLLEPEGLPTYRVAARIFRHARRRGIGLGTVDSLLAALALGYGVELFTLDLAFPALALSELRLYAPGAWRP